MLYVSNSEYSFCESIFVLCGHEELEENIGFNILCDWEKVTVLRASNHSILIVGKLYNRFKYKISKVPRIMYPKKKRNLKHSYGPCPHRCFTRGVEFTLTIWENFFVFVYFLTLEWTGESGRVVDFEALFDLDSIFYKLMKILFRVLRSLNCNLQHIVTTI